MTESSHALASRRREARPGPGADGASRISTRRRRAPDNVLYLTSFWRMKGFDVVVFPREGEPTLSPRAVGSTTRRGRRGRRLAALQGLRADDPRPPVAALARARGRRARARLERIGLELSQARRRRPDGRRADDVHEGVFDAFPAPRRDAAARRGALDQDRPGDRADPPRERSRRGGDGARPRRDQAGDEEARSARRVGGIRARRGHGLPGQVELARGHSLVWSGPGIRLHGDGRPPGRRGRADAVRVLGLRRRLLVRPHEERRPRRADAAYDGCSSCCSPSTTTRSPSRDGASLPSSTAAP